MKHVLIEQKVSLGVSIADLEKARKGTPADVRTDAGYTVDLEPTKTPTQPDRYVVNLPK